jgi:threonine dehydrogenase-like Zn-dependent dehydrogenase
MADTGRAAIFNGIGKPFEIIDYPVPELEPGAILVRITMATICGSDLHIWRGDIDIAALGLPLPAIIGHEMTGTVARLGEGVSTDSAGQPLAVGDRVVYHFFNPCGRCPVCLRGEEAACSMNQIFIFPIDAFPHFTGAYAEYYYLRPGQTVVKVPDELTDAMVAPLNCALSEVIYGFNKIGPVFGETVVIQGAGGLGIYATAVSREMGADRVIVVDGIAERLELAKAFGADDLIDMREYGTPEERVQRVMDMTGYRGAGVVAEMVGLPQAIPEGLDMLGSGGRYLEIGNISPGMTTTIDPSSIIRGSKTIHGVVFYGRDTLKKSLDFLIRTRDKYPFEKLLSRSYPLEEIDRAFEEQEKKLVARAAIIP